MPVVCFGSADRRANEVYERVKGQGRVTAGVR